MSTFGFDKAKAGKDKPRISAKALAQKVEPISIDDKLERRAMEAGERVGFIDRERAETSAKPRGRRGREVEAQGKILISGPERVLEKFREFADDHNHNAYWNAIEALIMEYEKKS